MADTPVVAFEEALFEKIDARIREIVASMLPPVSVATQDDGDVVSNQYRIMNFQGDGVSVSEDRANRRTNIVIPGAPTATTDSTFISSAGNEVTTPITFPADTPPTGWELPAFNDSAWTASVHESGSNSGFFTVVPTTQWITDTTKQGDLGIGDQAMLVRRHFTLPSGTITAATLEINIDDVIRHGSPFINGHALALPTRPTSPLPVPYSTVSIPIGWLTAGADNVLAVDAYSHGGVLTITYRITVSYTAGGTDARYQLLSEKDQLNGYAGLDSDGLVDDSALADSGTPSSSTFLRGDRTWSAASTNAVTVQEVDGSPAVTATQIEFPNGTLTNPSSGVARYTPATTTAVPYALIQDQKAQNTAGGTFTSGAWRTRTLNTEVQDVSGIVSISANQMTLGAGTYRVRIKAPGAGVNWHQARLQNITDGATVLLGTSEEAGGAPTGVTTSSWVVGQFTLAGTKALEVQHWCTLTIATQGFGTPANITTEVYTVVEIWKEA